ncbi:UNVERIFIED_CONTAM: Retrovirus-related Pol polyprotein from transposon TNT 1-94 [Sesamum calycinum]|uniref:Retrovirus-related Pol polyprotein from transposon TNT 1-94 n=1 Tax=Sesamum calycinum TaxID=2727403 RepID=A0AAW2JJ97_9LAMI
MWASVDIDEPATYEKAVTSPNANEWITAMKEEMSSMGKNNVWELVDLPTGRKTIGNKWVLKVKRKADGSIDKFKARLVAKVILRKRQHFSMENWMKRSIWINLKVFRDGAKAQGNNMEMIVATQKWLSSTFEMKDMGEAEYILGVKIHRDRSKKLLSISQETYIKRII